MAKLLQQLFDTTRRFDMQAQPQLLLLQKTMVVVEGVARGLDPDFDIWAASRPVVERWMLDRLGPEARFREAAEGVGALGRVWKTHELQGRFQIRGLAVEIIIRSRDTVLPIAKGDPGIRLCGGEANKLGQNSLWGIEDVNPV